MYSKIVRAIVVGSLLLFPGDVRTENGPISVAISWDLLPGYNPISLPMRQALNSRILSETSLGKEAFAGLCREYGLSSRDVAGSTLDELMSRTESDDRAKIKALAAAMLSLAELGAKVAETRRSLASIGDFLVSTDDKKATAPRAAKKLPSAGTLEFSLGRLLLGRGIIEGSLQRAFGASAVSIHMAADGKTAARMMKEKKIHFALLSGAESARGELDRVAKPILAGGGTKQECTMGKELFLTVHPDHPAMSRMLKSFKESQKAGKPNPFITKVEALSPEQPKKAIICLTGKGMKELLVNKNRNGEPLSTFLDPRISAEAGRFLEHALVDAGQDPDGYFEKASMTRGKDFDGLECVYYYPNNSRVWPVSDRELRGQNAYNAWVGVGDDEVRVARNGEKPFRLPPSALWSNQQVVEDDVADGIAKSTMKHCNSDDAVSFPLVCPSSCRFDKVPPDYLKRLAAFRAQYPNESPNGELTRRATAPDPTSRNHRAK